MDDSPATRHALKTILASMAIQVDEVGNGQEAIEFCRRSPAPDLILLDMEMPVMDGLQFIKALRADRRWDGIRVVVCSGTANLGAVREALNVGADEYVSKPFSASSIRAKVEAPRAASRAGTTTGSPVAKVADSLDATLTRLASIAGRLVDETASLPAVQQELRTLSAALHQQALALRMPISDPGSTRTPVAPVPQPATPSTMGSAPFPVSPAPRTLRGTVLIIDDSEPILTMVRASLEPQGIRVVTSTSPMCNHLIVAEKPDLVLLDIEMPGMGGEQMAGAISRALERISGGTLLFYSGLPAEKLSATVERTRVMGALSKSLPARQFIDQVEAWLTKAKARIASSRKTASNF